MRSTTTTPTGGPGARARARRCAAAGMAAMGAATLARPRLVFDTFGMTAGSPEARNEVRAVYGGYGLAMSALLVWAAAREDELGDGVALTVGAALAGMAAGRIASARIDPPARGMHPVWTYCAIELAGAVALLGTSAPRRRVR